MKFTTLQRYILRQYLSYLIVSLLALNALFLIFDFFDRIDNILPEKPSVLLVLQYFFLKIPLMTNLMLPLACLSATLLTIGLLSRNSEITAMRASGVKLNFLAKPIIVTGLAFSLFSMLLSETVVPYATRRVKEIYNIDIKQKDKQGSYSQKDIWWRSKNDFYSVSNFDSRTNTLYGLSRFKLSDEFSIYQRTNANRATYVSEDLGWTMFAVHDQNFTKRQLTSEDTRKQFPLPIKKTPSDFYDIDTEPTTMSFNQLRRFIKSQLRNGIDVRGYYTDLYDKLAFPFICVIISMLVFPFALNPARSGSMAISVLSSILIGFSYYAVHSLCISLGRAEFFAPFFAAMLPNLLTALVAYVLMSGAEAPR